MSAQFWVEWTHANLTVFVAMASRAWWQGMALCFFLSTELDIVKFKTALLFFPDIRAGPSGSTPRARSMRQHSIMSLVTVFAATDLEP